MNKTYSHYIGELQYENGHYWRVTYEKGIFPLYQRVTKCIFHLPSKNILYKKIKFFITLFLGKLSTYLNGNFIFMTCIIFFLLTSNQLAHHTYKIHTINLSSFISMKIQVISIKLQFNINLDFVIFKHLGIGFSPMSSINHLVEVKE